MTGLKGVQTGYGPRGQYNQSRGYRTISRLNRSRKWRQATSYKDARAKSPFPDRPVR